MFGFNAISDQSISEISVLGITGFIFATDENDTGNIVGGISNQMDMHDGITKQELKRIRKIQKELEKAEKQRITLRIEKTKARKNAIADLVDPKPVVKKTITVPLERKEKIIETTIADLQAEKQAIMQSIIQRQEIARLQMELVIANARIAAERDDEEALLLLI